MTRSRNESEAKYKELIETLQSQLRRSKLIQNALDQQVYSCCYMHLYVIGLSYNMPFVSKIFNYK